MNTGNTRNRIDLRELIIKPLDPTMDRAAFCCGEDPLDNFFREKAADLHDAYKARVTVATYQGQIVGYYWLAVQTTPFDDSPASAEEWKGELDATPCVYLGMIATHIDYQENGIGRTLMVRAMRQTLAVADLVGVYALTLEAINEKKALQYERWTFSRFTPGGLHMYIAIPTIRAVPGVFDGPAHDEGPAA